MNIVRSNPMPVVQPENLPLQDGKPWCKDHEEFFESCICPKPTSTAEKDGWYIERLEGRLTAYPTEELYNELGLWIDWHKNDIVCTRCGVKVPIGELYSKAERDDMVESFYEIHYECVAVEVDNG